MSQNNDYSFNLDDILAEFSSQEPESVKPSSPSIETPAAKPVVEEPIIEAPPRRTPEPGSFEEFLEKQPDYLPSQGRSRKPSTSQRPRVQSESQPAPYTPPRQQSSQPDARRSQPERRHSQAQGRHGSPEPRTKRPGAEQLDPDSQSRRRRATGAQPSARAQRHDSERPIKAAPATAAILDSPVMRILYPVLALIALLTLCWILVNVHPDSGTVSSGNASAKLDLVSRLDTYANNAVSEAVGDLSYIPKIYTIPENDTVAPKPDSTKYGTTTDPNEVQAVIDSASVLLAGQEMIWNADLNFVAGSSIQYYCDDTILVIAWKEDIAGKCVTCSEVKVAHGSQVRRKIAGDTYSTGIRYYATDMAKQANAVVAINGDFYDFRQIGVTVYQRTLYRFAPDKLDSCHFTASGDMLFSYAGELSSEDYTKQFIADNDVVFTLSFGPILVDNGQLVETSSYPIGEITSNYSRSAIGQLDELHYLLMTVNYADGYTVAATMGQIGQFMYSKNCQKAYALDGGQTSIIVMDGKAVNHVDWDDERTMSDLVYFATAIPSEEGGQ